jgi:hypothetical protein
MRLSAGVSQIASAMHKVAQFVHLHQCWPQPLRHLTVGVIGIWQIRPKIEDDLGGIGQQTGHFFKAT